MNDEYNFKINRIFSIEHIITYNFDRNYFFIVKEYENGLSEDIKIYVKQKEVN